jgi:5-methylcytosine-specific restriction endonuclease McrBC regulatory subunit McrC
MSKALPQQVSITERQETTIENCPDTIGEDLRQADFRQTDTNKWVMEQQPIDGDSSRLVAEAVLDGNDLRISAEDVVGIVDLTPRSKLQIQPKIGWDDILTMFLTVHETGHRSVEHHGVPISDFLADDIGIEDLFVVIAVHYLQSLDPLHRYGLYRATERHREDAISSRGRIDIGRSIKNHRMGRPEQHYIINDVTHNTAVHKLIHRAGRELLRLFEQYADRYERDEYYRVFSRVADEVAHLESLGITSNRQTVADYATTSMADVPAQRREYYRDVVETSKMILSSSTGESVDAGERELQVNCIIDMEQLFEEYTQIVLQEELDGLTNGVQYEADVPLSVEQNPSLKPFDDSNRIDHEPDHLLCAGEEPIAVLDTKYYAADDDPTADSYTRSRMFSYGFLLDIRQMAFLTPLAKPRTRSLRSGGKVKVISATDGETFNVETYRQAIESYLADAVGEHVTYAEGYDDLLDDVRRRLVHKEFKQDYTDIDDADVWDIIADLDIKEGKEGLFAYYIMKAIGNSHAPVDFRSLDKRDRNRVKEQLRDLIRNAPDETDYIVPVWVPEEEVEDPDTLVETDCEHDHDYDRTRMSIIRMYALTATADECPQLLTQTESALRWRPEKQHRH